MIDRRGERPAFGGGGIPIPMGVGGIGIGLVVAHEMGHHVQNLLGISADVESAARADSSQRNALSVRLELQVETTASSVRRPGRIEPESWTHGSSKQRVRWFERGFADGDANACDTFGADTL